MNHDIFISYSSYDTDVVNKLVALLEQEGFSVWIDRHGIENGEDSKKEILRAIKESSVVLFFSSEYSNVSDWIAKEIGIALKYNKDIVPIKLDDSNFNETFEFDLINLDSVDYSKPSTQMAMREKMLRIVRDKLGRGSKAFESFEREHVETQRKAQRAAVANYTNPPGNRKPKSKKNLWIGFLAAAVVLLLLMVLLLKPKKADPDTQAFQTCQTITDYRAYIRDYGRNSLHYTEAQTFIDQFVHDSLQKIKDSLAQAQAQEQAMAEIKNEDDAYQRCTTIAACDSYLKEYPQGRYIAEVEAKKAELIAKGISGSANGHEYVDLGLPSGTLWATCNVGASKPEGYGNYYAWGETSTKSTYNWWSYKYANGNEYRLTKYCNNYIYGENGFVDNLVTLQGFDDPATIWGNGWHTPSKTQWDELLQNTTHQWTKKNGVAGRLFTSKKNKQTLFFPAAGRRWNSDLEVAGSCGHYWSRSLLPGSGLDGGPHGAWYLFFDSDLCLMRSDLTRAVGISVRPVR